MYELIAANKRNSWLLAIVMFGVLCALGFVIGGAWGSWQVGLALALIVAIVMAVSSYFSGGAILMAVSGAREIRKQDHPQLFNVVEEMTIAGGLPMPRIFVIDDTAPNAFATGRDPEHSMVAVTTGLLDKMNRSELQGVIAHEMSHIKNYDILFGMMMAVMVGVIALLCDFFLRSTFRGMGRRSSRRGKGGAAGGIFLLIALVLAILAPFISKLIQLAVSRQREYLADASAVLLTRDTEGLASALQKISSDKEVLEVANRATQHLYIVNPIKPFEDRAKALFSTHPPIQERIRRIRSVVLGQPA
jgi:heat shock protein HtpX